MRVEKIGKRQFAFDLLWDKNPGDAVEFVRDKLDEEPGYFTVCKVAPKANTRSLRTMFTGLKRKSESSDASSAGERATGETIGYAEGTVKGAVYSYAQALSVIGRDGFYVLPVGEDRFWYAIIDKGLVQPSSDRTVTKEKLSQLLKQVPKAYGVEVYSPDSAIPESREFDPVRAVEKLKLTPMRQQGKQENMLVGIIVLTVVIGGIGAGGYYYFFQKKGSTVDQAQVAEQQRQAYLTSAKAAFDEVPTDAAWAAEAYKSAVTSFTSYVGGWALEGFTCSPGTCSAIYVLPSSSTAYAISPVYDLYGRERVTIKGDQRGLDVVLSVDAPAAEAASDADVQSPSPARSRLLDTIGRLGMQFSEISVDGQPQTENLNAALAGPPSMPALFRDTVTTKHESAMDLVKMRLLSAYMADAGFVASTFSVTGGAGSLKPAWKITWVRIHGGEQ